MTTENPKTFLISFLAPASVLEDWAKVAPEEREPAEAKMHAAWSEWMRNHAHMIKSTDAGGKTKRISSDGISDTRNDIMLCSYIEAESHDAAAKAFQSHPHLQIPQASIEVMELRPMGG